MKNRNITFTAILLLLGCVGLACSTHAAAHDVNVVNTPNVNVVNTTANPVPILGTVRDADNPARQPVQVFISVTLNNVGDGESFVDIPAGKIFVVESASFEGHLPAGQTFQSVVVLTRLPLLNGGQPYLLGYELPFSVRAPNGYFGSQAMRLYAISGSANLGFRLLRDSASGFGFGEVHLSGYLVNAQ